MWTPLTAKMKAIEEGTMEALEEFAEGSAEDYPAGATVRVKRGWLPLHPEESGDEYRGSPQAVFLQTGEELIGDDGVYLDKAHPLDAFEHGPVSNLPGCECSPADLWECGAPGCPAEKEPDYEALGYPETRAWHLSLYDLDILAYQSTTWRDLFLTLCQELDVEKKYQDDVDNG